MKIRKNLSSSKQKQKIVLKGNVVENKKVQENSKQEGKDEREAVRIKVHQSRGESNQQS